MQTPRSQAIYAGAASMRSPRSPKMSLVMAAVASALVLAAYGGGMVGDAYAGGSGSADSELVLIGGEYHVLKVATDPAILSGDEEHVKLVLSLVNVDSEPNAPVSGVEYGLRFASSQNGDVLAVLDVYSPGDAATMLITPSEGGPSVSGETAEGGAWLASDDSPALLEAPIFLEGGLLSIGASITSIDSQPLESGAEFEALFSMGEYIPFTVDIDGVPSEIVFATYFDRIDEFSYDEQTRTLSAVMPFTWTEEYVEYASYIHSEYFIPKSIDLFESHEILLGVNGMDYFGTVDRSGADTTVIHYLLSGDKLRDMLAEVEPPYEDVMVFEVRAGEPRQQQIGDSASLESGDTVIILSSGGSEEFHLYLSAEPAGMISSGHDVTFTLEIKDADTGDPIGDSAYDLEVTLGDDVIISDAGREAQDGRDTVAVMFEDVGRAALSVSNIGGSEASGEFSFVVSEPHDMSAMDHGSGSSGGMDHGSMMGGSSGSGMDHGSMMDHGSGSSSGGDTQQGEMVAMDVEMALMVLQHEAMMIQHETMLAEHETMMSDDSESMDVGAHMAMIADHEAKMAAHMMMIADHGEIVQKHEAMMDMHGMSDKMMLQHEEMMSMHELMTLDHELMTDDYDAMRADHETMMQMHQTMGGDGMMMGDHDNMEHDAMAAMNSEMDIMMVQHEAMMVQHETMLAEHETMMSDDSESMDVGAHMAMIADHEAKMAAYMMMIADHGEIVQKHMAMMDDHSMSDEMMLQHEEMMGMHELMMLDHDVMSDDYDAMRADHEQMKQMHHDMSGGSDSDGDSDSGHGSGGGVMVHGTDRDQMAVIAAEMTSMTAEHETMMQDHETMMQDHETMMNDDGENMDIDAHMAMIGNHEAMIFEHKVMVESHMAMMEDHEAMMDTHGMDDEMMRMHEEMMGMHELMMLDHELMDEDHDLMRADHEQMRQMHQTMASGGDNGGGGGCLIATAAFGSELAPQIQQLRELRDGTVLATESGAAFMSGFNSIYYAFSPAVADAQRENPAFKDAVKVVLTPMISSLSLLNHADIDTESEMIMYGAAVVLLNLGMYVGVPVFAAVQCTRLARAKLAK